MDLRVRGSRRELPPGIDLAAFRIVQEALTNVVKHADTPSCRVIVSYGTDELSVEITDEGRGSQVPARSPRPARAAQPRPGGPSGAGGEEPAGGHGLIGMRERVSLYGGELSRGAAAGARFPGGGAAADRGRRAMTIRVLVADDQALVRVGFRGIIAATPGLTVVGEAGTGAEAVETARATRPDVVLMDVRMPVMDGIEATRRITGSARTADVRVLILTTFDLDEYVYAALRAGASGFLLKDTMPADLLNAIRVIAAGDALLAPSVTRRLLGEFASRPNCRRRPVPAAARSSSGT